MALIKGTEAFSKIAELIDNKKYKTLIISALFFVVFIGGMGWMSTKVSSIDKAVKKIMVEEKSLISDEKDNAINNILIKLRSDIGATRVFHVIYHNGMMSLDGIGFRRASVVHECKAEYLDTYLSYVVNVPMSVFSYWNMMFKETGRVEYPVVDSIVGTERGIYYLFKSGHVMSAYFYSYIGDDAEPKGFIGIEFVNTESVLTKENRTKVESAVNKIAGILYDIRFRGGNL